MSDDHEQRLKSRLLQEIEVGLHAGYQFDTLTAPALVLKTAKVLEIDNSILLTNLTMYRNWAVHAKIDRRQGGLATVVEGINDKLAKARADNGLAANEYFGDIYDRHHFWSELTHYVTSLQPLLWDLKEFCRHFGLDQEAVNDKGWWYRFKKSFFTELIDVKVELAIADCPIKTICIVYASEDFPKTHLPQMLPITPHSMGCYVVQQSVYKDGDTREDIITIFKR